MIKLIKGMITKAKARKARERFEVVQYLDKMGLISAKSYYEEADKFLIAIGIDPEKERELLLKEVGTIFNG